MLINAVLVCVSLILFPAEKYPTTGTFASDGILKGEDKYSIYLWFSYIMAILPKDIHKQSEKMKD